MCTCLGVAVGGSGVRAQAPVRVAVVPFECEEPQIGEKATAIVRAMLRRDSNVRSDREYAETMVRAYEAMRLAARPVFETRETRPAQGTS